MCALTGKPKIIIRESQVLLATWVQDKLYACAVRTGPGFNHCDLLTTRVRNKESNAQAILRLGCAYFIRDKPVQRAIIKSAAKAPIEVEYTSSEGYTIKAAIWGVWLHSEIAVLMKAPLLEDYQENGHLAENPKSVWMDADEMLSVMAVRPYGSAIAKASCSWLNILSKQHMEQCFPSVIPQAQQAINAPKIIKEWMTYVLSSDKGTIERRSRESPPHSIDWVANQAPTPSMKLEMLPKLVATAQRLPQASCEAARLQQVINHARHRAQGHGCQTISARDLIEASQALNYEDKHHAPRPCPEAMPPQHYPQMMQATANLAEIIDKDETKGIGRPWVLVCCEKSATIALQFKLAGCRVATSDISDTEDPSIDHFKGDARKITHLGFDLIIATPPCTHLCNASVVWLTREPHRWESLRQAAMLFRDFYNSPAPFVCLENPPMSRYARQHLDGLRPTQIVHPHEHGHSHSKPTGLFVRGALPPLQATCLMTGRDKSLRNLPQSCDRGAMRGTFCIGIASAMSCQWVPTLIEYNRKKVQQRARPNLSEIIREFNMEEGKRPMTEPNIATIVSPEGVHHIRHVAMIHSKPEPVGTTWVVCPHGAVLVKGEDQGLEELTQEDPMPRCGRTECIQQANQWWEQQNQASEYRKTCDVEAFKNDALPNHRPYPIKRIHKKGTLWYAWAPTAGRDSTAGHYKWSRLNDAAQNALTDEMDRIKRLRVADEGHYTSQRNTPLYPQLPTIFSDNSVGFKSEQYEKQNTRNKHTGEAPGWEEWRNAEKLMYTKCPTCGADRKSSGRKTCGCSENAALEARPNHSKSPKYNRSNQGNSKTSPKLTRPIKFVKAIQTDVKDKLLSRCKNTIETNKSSIAMIAAMPEKHDVEIPIARQVSNMIAQAVNFGVAKTPKKGSSQAHCAYIQDVIIIDAKSDKPTKSYNVACFIRYALGDTGAGISVIAGQLLKLLPTSALNNLRAMPAHANTGVEAANGTPLVILGTVDLTFFLGGRIFCHTFQVIEGDNLLILGNDFIASHQGSVSPRLSGDKNNGYIEVNHEISGCRVRSPLIATPRDWIPLKECSGPQAAPKEGDNGGETHNKRSSSNSILTIEKEAREQDTLQNLTMQEMNKLGMYPNKNKAVKGTQVKMLGSITAISHQNIKSSPNEYVDVSMSDDDLQQTDEQPEPRAHKDFVELKMEEITDPSEDELYNKHLIKRDHLLVTQGPMQIPPRSERIISVRCPKGLLNHKGPLLIQALPYREGLGAPPVMVASSISEANGEFIPVRLLNTSRQIAHLAELTAIGTVETDVECPANETPKDHEYTWESLTASQKEVIQKCEIDPDGTLNEEQLGKIRDLLARNVDVFAKNTKAPGVTHLMEVSLELRPGARPHKHAPSKMGSVGNTIAQGMVDEMLENGIIRKSNSPWASRLVIVKKKSGDNRCCVDLRDLNSKLLIQDTPLPRCDSSIARLASAPDWKTKNNSTKQHLYFSVLDLCQGFHCLPIKETDKEKLAFVTERGKYEYNYLPFGVNCGPSYMQRLMECALDGLSWEICIIYMDDIAVFSAGETREIAFVQQMERLALVLERLRWSGLTAKPSKCKLFALSVEYLGHVVSQKGVSPNPKLIQGVMNINPKEVNTIEAVRSFLGLTGYYRSFVKDYHLISGPLTALTKKNVNVPYESQLPEAQEAIIKLKEALTSAPVLAPPREDREFILHTDAATGHGIGGILLQRENGENDEYNTGAERPISYYGRRCTGAESNYSVTECELLAVIESIKHFRPYLWGRHFVVVTDHSALRWLNTMKESVNGGASSRLTRWSLHLMEYSFTVKHKAGKLHQDADAISRLVGCIRPRSELVKQLESDEMDNPDTAEYALDKLRIEMNKPTHVALLMERQILKVPGFLPQVDGMEAATRMQSKVAAMVLNAITSSKEPTTGELHEPVQLACLKAGEAIRREQMNSDVPRADILRTEQGVDSDCTELMNYIISGSTVEDKKRQQWVIRTAEHCRINGGLLCHSTTINNNPYDRVWIPRACRQPFLEAYHDQMGHPSQGRMYRLMQRSVFWPGMSADVTEHASTCHECAFSKRGSKGHGATRPPQVGTYPFEIMVADILSMKATADGFSKVIIFACSLSRWIEAVPLKKDPTSEEVLDIFMNVIVCRHGVPRCIRSDCGSNLTSKLCQEIYRLCGVELAQSTAYHHSSLGLVERINATLTEMTKASDPTGQDWAKHLPFLCFAYNATPHRVTRESPACLVYGRDLRMFQNIDLYSAAPTREEGELSEYARNLFNKLRLAWDVALKHTHEAQAADAERIDVKRHLNTEYQENDRVLMRIETPHMHKLSYKYSGPYRIAEVIGKGVYRLRDLHSRRMIDRVSVDRLRRYQTVTDLEPVASDEYLVKAILDHREIDGNRQFLVHFRGFQKKDAEWTDEENLMTRCSDLIAQYIRARSEDPAPKQNTKNNSRNREKSKPLSTKLGKHTLPRMQEPSHSEPEASEPNETTETGYPLNVSKAQYVRGAWGYLTHYPTSRGFKPRWLGTANFTEKDRELLKPLRQEYLDTNPLAKITAALVPCATTRNQLSLRGGGPPLTNTTRIFPFEQKCLDNDIITLLVQQLSSTLTNHTVDDVSRYLAGYLQRFDSTKGKTQKYDAQNSGRVRLALRDLNNMSLVCKRTRGPALRALTLLRKRWERAILRRLASLQSMRIFPRITPAHAQWHKQSQLRFPCINCAKWRLIFNDEDAETLIPLILSGAIAVPGSTGFSGTAPELPRVPCETCATQAAPTLLFKRFANITEAEKQEEQDYGNITVDEGDPYDEGMEVPVIIRYLRRYEKDSIRLLIVLYIKQVGPLFHRKEIQQVATNGISSAKAIACRRCGGKQCFSPKRAPWYVLHRPLHCSEKLDIELSPDINREVRGYEVVNGDLYFHTLAASASRDGIAILLNQLDLKRKEPPEPTEVTRQSSTGLSLRGGGPTVPSQVGGIPTPSPDSKSYLHQTAAEARINYKTSETPNALNFLSNLASEAEPLKLGYGDEINAILCEEDSMNLLALGAPLDEYRGLTRTILTWLDRTSCSRVESVRMRLFITFAENWCIDIIPKINHATYQRMSEKLFELVCRAATVPPNRTAHLANRRVLLPCRTCRRYTNGRCIKCGMEAYCNVDCKFINARLHYILTKGRCGVPRQKGKTTVLLPSGKQLTLPLCDEPRRPTDPTMLCTITPSQETTKTPPIDLFPNPEKTDTYESVPNQVGGTSTSVPPCMLGNQVELPLIEELAIVKPEHIPTGPSRLVRLFDAMDAIAQTTKIRASIVALAQVMGHPRPSITIQEVIYTVLIRAVNPQKYPSDRIARDTRQVKEFLFNAWRFRIHTLSHSIPVTACDLAKVMFISPYYQTPHVWVGTRRPNPNVPIINALDIPGSDRSNQDVNSRATAWRGVATQDLRLAPYLRTRLARVLSCTYPTIINQPHPLSGKSIQIALWTLIIRSEETDHLAPTTHGRNKWKACEWVPLIELEESLRAQGLIQYAEGCRTAADNCLNCHEILKGRN